MSIRKALAEAFAALALAALTCVAGWGEGLAQVPNASTHTLSMGDVVDVTLFDGVTPVNATVQVDKTGCISLALLGPVEVQGLYDYEAVGKLTQLYSKYYISPVVTLAIRSFGTFKVYLFGPDVTSQLMDVPTGTRLLDLIQTLSTVSPGTGKPLLTTGRCRRMHVVRGGFSLTALLAPPAKAKPQPVSPAENLLEAAAPAAVARQDANLAAYTNWRAWIDERQRDPNSQVWVIDPLRLTVEGELSTFNIPLEDGDVLYIPSPERYVDIEGVSYPGRYELLGDETLGDIVRLAGTPDIETDLRNAVVRRYDAQGDWNQVYFNFYPALDDVAYARSIKLENRDKISFYARESRVFVLGEVNAAGAFAMTYDSTVLDYIALARGETPEANLAWIAIIRQGRDRLDPLKGAEVLQVNFKQIHKGLPNCQDISVQPGDVIYVPPKGFQFEFTDVLQAVATAVTGFNVYDKAKDTKTTIPADTASTSGQP